MKMEIKVETDGYLQSDTQGVLDTLIRLAVKNAFEMEKDTLPELSVKFHEFYL